VPGSPVKDDCRRTRSLTERQKQKEKDAQDKPAGRFAGFARMAMVVSQPPSQKLQQPPPSLQRQNVNSRANRLAQSRDLPRQNRGLRRPSFLPSPARTMGSESLHLERSVRCW